MANQKKQHYVPKFYLKYFSIDSEKKNLCLYVKDNKKFIASAALKNQAYEDYFYGKENDIENELSKVEAVVSKTITKLIEKNYSILNDKVEYLNILLFIVIQLSRTKAKANESDEFINLLTKELLSKDERFKEKSKNLTFRLKSPSVFNLLIASKNLSVVTDLSYKIIENNTKIPFITSDNPIILYNQFLEQRNYEHGSIGLATKGLQIIYPLSPSLLLILFDGKVYKIGNKRQVSISTDKPHDVKQINLLQFLNSDKVVYTNNKDLESYLNILSQISNKYSDNKFTSDKFSEHTNTDGTHSIIMHHSKENTRIKLLLSFIKETKHAKQYNMNDGYVVKLRNESMRENK